MPLEIATSSSQLSVLSGVPGHIADPVAYIRANNPMPLHAEEQIDTAITEVALDDLPLVNDLTSRGLETPLSNWLGHMNLIWQKRSRIGNPIASLTPQVGLRREDKKYDLALDTLPVYCWSDEFTIDPKLWAEWEYAVSSGKTDAMLDVGMVQDTIRRMNEAIDLAVLEGPPIKPNGVHIDGLLDTPFASPFGSGKLWDDPTKTGDEIRRDVFAGINLVQSQHHNQPVVMYVGKLYNRILNGDYIVNATVTNGTTKTIRTRILEDTDILDIVRIPTLPKDTILLVEPKKTNLDVIVGQKPTVFSWMGEGPVGLATRRWLAVACVMLRIREDYDGQSGVIKMVPTV